LLLGQPARIVAVMTIYDLVFLIGAIAAISTIVRATYLLVRGRVPKAGRVLMRLSIGAVVYFAALLLASFTQPLHDIHLGVPNCFDDFCIAVDSAVRVNTIGSVSSEGDFVVVSGRVLSKARRRQRETDVRGVLMDGAGARHEASVRGQQALEALGGAGSRLTDFVEPYGANAFKLVFDVPKTSQEFAFITAHGWFPAALIIGDQQSPLHRPSIVRLPRV
jgi:hypothetical protein